METKNLVNTLGLATKAKSLIWGQKLFDQLKTNKIKLVIVASDMGPSQKKKLVEKCTFYKATLYESGLTANQLGHACGQQKVVAVGISEGNILKLFKKYL